MHWSAVTPSFLRRPSTGFAALLAGFSLLVIADRAASTTEPNQPSKEAKQLQQLNERVHILERRISTLEQVGIRDDRADLMTSPEDAEGEGATAAPCAFPYEMSAPGVLHLKDECVTWNHGTSCMTPYKVDDRGVLNVNPNCLNGKELTNCDPPFVYDDRGVKAYLPGCYPEHP